MTWLDLGTVNPNYEWQLLVVPSFTARTFRLSHSNQAISGTKALLAQSFGSTLQIYRPRSFFSSSTSKIYRLFMPDEFIEEGFSRFVAIKLAFNSRVFDFNWQVQVEAINIGENRLSNIEALAIENRANVALLQQQLDRIEQNINTTT